MIRRIPDAGAGHSVVEHDGLRHFFAVVAPTRQGSLQEQIDSVLQTLQTLLQEEGGGESIVTQSIFLSDIKDRAACQQSVKKFYGKKLPATTYIPQPPCDGSDLLIEAWAVESDDKEFAIERDDRGTVLVRHRDVLWAYLADARPEVAAGSVYDRSLAAFRSAETRLHSVGLRFDHVIRSWIYLGGITMMDGQTCRYQELNRARTDYYRNVRFGGGLIPRTWNKPVFPASTGVGVNGEGVLLHCIALQTDRPDVALAPLENPRQTSAYDYTHHYGPETPKFARAMAVVTGESAVTFISGTASITASQTRHEEDFERQLQQSLDNIEVLLSSGNFQNHGLPGVSANLDDLALARIYLKRREDGAAAREICRRRLGELPMVFVVGDICRPELLVEIEGIAFS